MCPAFQAMSNLMPVCAPLGWEGRGKTERLRLMPVYLQRFAASSSRNMLCKQEVVPVEARLEPDLRVQGMDAPDTQG